MYKVGDKVIVRDDLAQYEAYGIDIFCDEMEECLGCEAIITEVVLCSEGIKYHIDIDDYYYNWTDEMLLPSESLEVRVFKDFLRSHYGK